MFKGGERNGEQKWRCWRDRNAMPVWHGQHHPSGGVPDIISSQTAVLCTCECNSVTKRLQLFRKEGGRKKNYNLSNPDPKEDLKNTHMLDRNATSTHKRDRNLVTAKNQVTGSPQGIPCLLLASRSTAPHTEQGRFPSCPHTAARDRITHQTADKPVFRLRLH